jgi:hypothetical protein
LAKDPQRAYAHSSSTVVEQDTIYYSCKVISARRDDFEDLSADMQWVALEKLHSYLRYPYIQLVRIAVARYKDKRR